MILLIVSSVLLAVLCACAVLIGRFLGAGSVGEADLKWLEEFSVERYRPMERLLAGSDHRFYRAEMRRAFADARDILAGRSTGRNKGPDNRRSRDAFQWYQFRAKRRQIFRGYLRSLSRDFRRLQAIAGAQLPVLQTIDPQISISLFKLRISFATSYALIELQLAVDFFCLRPIEVWPLMEYINGLNTQLRWCAPELHTQSV